MPSIESHNTKRTETWERAAARSGQRGTMPGRAADPWKSKSPTRPLGRLAFRCAARLSARQGLLLLSCLLLIGFSIAVKFQGRRRSADPAEFSLLSDPFSPRFNSTSAEAHTKFVDRAPQEFEHSLSSLAGTTAETEFPLLVSCRAESAPPEGERLSRLEPAAYVSLMPVPVENCYQKRDPHQGDSPMSRTWKLLSLHAILAASLASSPVFAQATKTDGQSTDQTKLTDAEKLTDIMNQLKELKKTVADLRSDTAAIQKAVERLPTDLDLNAQVAKVTVGELRDQINQLKTEIQEVRNRLRDGTRVSAFGPTDVAPPATGMVDLVNNYNSEMSIVVNRVSHRLPPGTRQRLPTPAGTFTYEVLGLTRPASRFLAANDTFTIEVRPQP